jgi:hypothetical protein
LRGVLLQVDQGHQDLRSQLEFEGWTCANGSFAFRNVQWCDFSFVLEGFECFEDGVEFLGCDSSQVLEAAGRFWSWVAVNMI